MKTEIKINEKNLSRYNKRLQKAIEKNLGHKIKLSEASDIFAQVLGMTSLHELQAILEKDVIKEFKRKINSASLSTMDKIIIILTQIQKMMMLTKAEYWYVPLRKDGDNYNKYYGKAEYNGLDAICTFTGFREFVYNPYPYERKEEDSFFADMLDEGLSMECIEFGHIDDDIKTIKSRPDNFYDEDDELYISFKIRKQIYASKKETKLLKEMLEFSEPMLEEIINLMKSDEDFLLVEKGKITIMLDGEIRII